MLIALDTEYRTLVAAGNSFRADYVQSPYLWQLRRMAPKPTHALSDFIVDDDSDDATDDEDGAHANANRVLLTRACLKYVDGAVLAPANAEF